MEEKRETGKVIIIVILVLMVLALGGYIVYDKFLSKEEVADVSKDEKEKEIEIDNLEVNDDLVVSLVEKITSGMDCTDFKDIYFKDGVFKGSDFSNQEIYSLALKKMLSEVAGDSVTGTGYKDFSVERLESEIVKIVGKDYQFNHKSYVSCPAWDYDATAKNYKAPASSACGCTTGPYHTIAKTAKAFKEGDKVEIYQRVIFVDTITGKGYSDSKKTKEITGLTTLSADQWGNPVDNIDESNDANIAKGTLYKLVFEKENDEYIFVSSEPVNE